MELTTLTAVSPIDGRYADKTRALRPIFSEYGLIHHRVRVEVEWLKALAANAELPEITPLSNAAIQYLDDWVRDFSLAEAKKIKEIEATTNHDVKAVEYFLRQKFQRHGELKNHLAHLHFACTSEDINNLSHALMLKTAREKILMPAIAAGVNALKNIARRYQNLAMICRTHGQAASPSTLGKEIGVYIHRLQRQRDNLGRVAILGKMNGAVGNFNAHIAAYPSPDWMALSRRFVERLGLEWNPHTTQIESHDYIAEYFNSLSLLNTILIDLCRDIWGYIALGYFRQRVIDTEVGSSTMPHKVNPIDFENAEGNLGLANATAGYFAQKLPISRWQRDLSDSTTLRNMGTVIAHNCIAFDSLSTGLSKLRADRDRIAADLENAWEVLAEPVQTVMRRYGVTDSYEQLKSLTRGQQITRQSLHEFINGLAIPEDARNQLLSMTPGDYVGNAERQAEIIIGPEPG